ncbi:MAG TPA: hypothetical protein VMV94_12785 [Phycisphaerae bacterium]|nr:hypothetical protein [Phycisphaerae bacterium]
MRILKNAAMWTIALVLVAGSLSLVSGCDINVQGTITGNELDMKVDAAGCGLNVNLAVSDMPLVEVHNYVQ